MVPGNRAVQVSPEMVATKRMSGMTNDVQKNLIPLDSHSTLQLSTAIKPAALVAE